MKVHIGSAIHRSVEPLHMKSLLALLTKKETDPGPTYEYWPQIGDALIERARGISATYFLRHTDADVHLSLDSDIVEFEGDAIDKMCEQAEKYDIVGGVYICRSVSRTFPATFFEEDHPIQFAFDPTPHPVKWVATGCLAVHRRVFERLAETMPLLHERDGKRAFYNFYHSMEYDTDQDGDEMGRILLSEDYAFSQRAKDLGFTCYINPAVRMGHMGPYSYRLEDMGQELLAPQPIKITRAGPYWKVELPGTKETPESQGRIPEGKGGEIRERFTRAERRRREKQEKKALTRTA